MAKKNYELEVPSFGEYKERCRNKHCRGDELCEGCYKSMMDTFLKDLKEFAVNYDFYF